MKKVIGIFCSLILVLSFMSCNDESVDVDEVTAQTLLVYMPWSGTTNNKGLYNIFLENIDSIESAIIKNKGLNKSRLLIFISESSNASKLYEVEYANSSCTQKLIKEYSGSDYTSSAGITDIMNTVKSSAPALNYAMIIGCHGSGWTLKDTWTNYPYSAKKYMPYRNDNYYQYPETRFFGSANDMNYATDIYTLAQGLNDASMKMQFILFDDCYMANAEVAYELRNVTNYLIASTSEIMAVGMPYASMWTDLASSTPNYSSAVTAFKDFYSSYTVPSGTLSAIDCREMESLAEIMKQINSRNVLPDSLRDSIQVLDGFHKTIFYDMGDYVKKLCNDKGMYEKFSTQLDKTVYSKCYTDSVYSYIYSVPTYFKIKTFSGITISDLSQNDVALKGINRTAWYKATH